MTAGCNVSSAQFKFASMFGFDCKLIDIICQSIHAIANRSLVNAGASGIEIFIIVGIDEAQHSILSCSLFRLMCVLALDLVKID